MNELQRIGRVLGISTDMDESRLCLLIQDKIKKKDEKIKEKEFCYYMVKAQNEKLQSEIKNLHNEYAESIGINEHMIVKQSRDVAKKELNKVLEKNHELNETIRLYKEREFKDRLKKIEGVR